MRHYSRKIKAAILAECLLLCMMAVCMAVREPKIAETASTNGKDYIKWVEFQVSYEAMCQAYEFDVDTYGSEIHLDWIELLSYLGAKHGGDFSKSMEKEMTKLAEKLSGGKTTMDRLTKDMKYYEYYLKAYSAVLGGLVGEYQMENKENGKSEWETCYGLKGYSPIAKDFPYSDYADFGASRSYGYKRPHLGHDMMGQIGTPIRILNGIKS